MSTVTAVPIAPTRTRVLVVLGIGIIVALIAALLLARQGDDFLARNARASGVVTTASGLEYKVIDPGSGPKPTDADVALVMYEGKLLNGTTFDRSQQPVPMPVAGVVPGFSEGLKLMSKGARYRFWIKPSLGYGDHGAGPIPANSTLTFDVQLLDFLPEEAVRRIQQQQMMRQSLGGGAAVPGGVPAPGGR